MTRKKVVQLIIAMMFLSIAAPAFAYEVGVAPATRKILADTPMPTEQSVHLSAAQNEWEAFQIVVRHDGEVKDINVSLSDLTGPGDETLSKENALLYREWFLDITNDSSGSLTLHERAVGYYPDPLIPFIDPYSDGLRNVGAPFDIDASLPGVVFVDWYVPENQTPGDYTGTATVTAQDQDPVEIPITITVWEFAIPKERSIATAFGFGESRVHNYHGGDNATDEFKAEMEHRYFESLHVHRMDTTHLVGPVTFEFDDQDNLLPIDWTAYDAYIEPFVSGSMYADGIGVKRFNVKHFKPGSGTGNMTEAQYIKAAKAFAEHLNEKGWWENAYVYASDEPWLKDSEESWAKIKADVTLLLQASDLYRDKVLVTGPWNETVDNEVGIWCPVTPMYENWWWIGADMAGREKYAELLKRGKELWFYVCNANVPPYAGYDIDTATGFEPRMVKWSTWYERATGFLYWRTNAWVNDDPWNQFLDAEKFGETFARNGDGFLFYPGDHNGLLEGKGSPDFLSIDGPIVSYRMKQIRDGLEDWELFIMASNLGAEDYVRAQVGRAYRRFGDFCWESCTEEGMYCPDDQPWTLDENLLLEIRNNVAQKVLFLLYPEKYDDPEAPVVDGDIDDEGEVEDTTKPKGSSSGCGGGSSSVLLVAGLVAVLRRRKQLT